MCVIVTKHKYIQPAASEVPTLNTGVIVGASLSTRHPVVQCFLIVHCALFYVFYVFCIWL